MQMFWAAITSNQKSLQYESKSQYWQQALRKLFASFYKIQAKYNLAKSLFLRSLEIREKVWGPDHPYVATSLNNLAMLYVAQGDYVQAEPLFKRALAINEKVLGRDHLEVAAVLFNCASLYRLMERYKEADAMEKKAEEIRGRLQ